MRFSRRSEKVDVLQRVPLFQNLGKRDLDQVARIADEVECPAGKVLMKQGESGRELVLVVDGAVRVEQDGKAIATRGAGEVLGELSLLDGKERSATVVTEEPSTILVIHWSQFWPLLEQTPGVQRKLLVTLAGRLREAEGRHL